MFAWLKNLIKVGSEEEKLDFYKPGQRYIYHYFDGVKEVAADPLVLYKKLMDVGPSLDIDLKLAVSPHSEARKGHDNAIAAIRSIFSVNSLEEGGLTEREVIDLFDHFMIYSQWLKKNSNPSPTSSDNSAVSVPSPDAPLPTRNSLPSGSTEDVPSTAKPGPLPSVLG